jgi:hypothetical protein
VKAAAPRSTPATFLVARKAEREGAGDVFRGSVDAGLFDRVYQSLRQAGHAVHERHDDMRRMRPRRAAPPHSMPKGGKPEGALKKQETSAVRRPVAKPDPGHTSPAGRAVTALPLGRAPHRIRTRSAMSESKPGAQDLRPPDLESFPIHEPILLVTFIVVSCSASGLVGAVTKYKLWGYLWREWFTSVDHKKIGIMYMILGIIMLLRGFSDALMMRRSRRSRSARTRATSRPPLRSDLHRARDDHDLLRGDPAGRRPRQLRDAAADRRARRRLPVPQQSQLLADGGGRAAGDDVAVRRRVRARRLAVNYVPVANLQNSPDTGPITIYGRCR